MNVSFCPSLSSFRQTEKLAVLLLEYNDRLCWNHVKASGTHQESIFYDVISSIEFKAKILELAFKI